MQYYNENTTEKGRIIYWSQEYAKHLNKWLVEENFTKSKTIIKYENLKENPYDEFAKICSHFNASLDNQKIDKAILSSSKAKLKSKTLHDPQVINLKDEYEHGRWQFREANLELITAIVSSIMGEQFKNFFEQTTESKAPSQRLNQPQ